MRSLAAKSDESAKSTKQLIDNSLAAVRAGSEAVARVTDALEQTSELSGHVSTQMEIVVDQFSLAAEE